MIVLYGFAPSFGLPDAGPFVIKTEVQLKMLGLPYRKALDGRPTAPKGRLPYIDDEGTIVADSALIRLHLENKHGADLDQGLTSDERAMAWACERMAEDHMYWAMVHSRWSIDENFEKGPAHFFDHLPDSVQQSARDAQRANVLGYLYGQGFGRHSEKDIAIMADLSYASLARLLGTKRYLMGSKPCGADASIFAQIASVLTPHFNSRVRDAARAYPNLVQYSERMMAKFFPEYAKES